MSSEFTVATFNVENLNSVGTSFAGRPAMLPFTAALFGDKARFIASALDRIGRSSIIGVQEVFDRKALEDCVAQSSLTGARVLVPASRVQADALSGRAVAEGPNVGLVTTFPVISVNSITDFPKEVDVRIPLGAHDDPGEIIDIDIKRFERPVLRAEIDVPGLPGLTVLVAHLKSKRAKVLRTEDERQPLTQDIGSLRSLIVRACEAAALRSIIRSIRNERAADGRRRPLIVLGDVNDDLQSVTTRLLEGQRPFARDNGRVPRSIYAERTASLMLNVIELCPPADGVRYSYVHDGTGSLIDMIFVSADFFAVEKRQRADILTTAIDIAHFGDRKPLPRIELPLPAAFAAPPPPKDPLDDVVESSRDLPSATSDHGIPMARIKVT
jgi:hypothetical protein